MSDSGQNDDSFVIRKVNKLNCQVFKRDTPRRTEPSVTLERNGRISVNGEAARQLGKPSAIELMYDAQYRAIGLWAAKEKTENTFDASYGRGPKREAGDSFNISVVKFCKHINLDVAESRRFKPTIEDDVLYFFLDQGVTIPARKKPAKPK